jgi:hypothetical protein
MNLQTAPSRCVPIRRTHAGSLQRAPQDAELSQPSSESLSTLGQMRLVTELARSSPVAHCAVAARVHARCTPACWRPANCLPTSWIRDVQKLQPSHPSGLAASAPQFPGARRVPLSELQIDGAGVRARNASPKPLPSLSMECSRRRSPRRSQLRMRRPDGADRDLGSIERRVVARASLQCVRLSEGQSHRRRRQRVLVDVARGTPGRAASIPARRAGSIRSALGSERRLTLDARR